ncbi:MAG: sulfide/dihydroorotate dehydrogenase-like FAD/NAD-binding protein, partial [Clostridia bacterium]|nr:sulfide/dihydroorotate dehydrogenase-like FAD/NAD-binding protein [Clostridia bacterium]
MYKIVSKKYLNDTVCQMDIHAPYVTIKAKAGQFIILRVDADGERIPLTIAGVDKEKGLVTIIFQLVGASTIKLGSLKEGEYICDFAGPLGKATHTEGLKKVAVVG